MIIKLLKTAVATPDLQVFRGVCRRLHSDVHSSGFDRSGLKSGALTAATQILLASQSATADNRVSKPASKPFVLTSNEMVGVTYTGAVQPTMRRSTYHHGEGVRVQEGDAFFADLLPTSPTLHPMNRSASRRSLLLGSCGSTSLANQLRFPLSATWPEVPRAMLGAPLLRVLPVAGDVLAIVGSTVGNHSVVDVVGDLSPAATTSVGDAPESEPVVYQARRIQKIRRWHMNRHHLKKLRKRMRFEIRKQQMERNKKKEKARRMELANIKKDGENFDALAFVKKMLETAKRGGYKAPSRTQKQLSS